MATIFDLQRKGSSNWRVPAFDNADWDEIPAALLDSAEARLGEAGEVDVVRHYTALSRLNFGVDSGMYPLGSCTMKYNPKINEKIAAMPGFAAAHPLAGDEHSQGALEVLYRLERALSDITGMGAFSLAPAAGAHGELAGVMIMKKYFEERGETRPVVLIPDTAHGTNPASVAICGFEVKVVPSTPDGGVDMDALRGMLDDSVAGMMLTSPNTLGLFNSNVHEIADMLHAVGALFYCDGANLNAVMGVARIADMGFDIMHINLHKTFSTPHGGGGPGSGPVGVRAGLEPFLPVPRVVRAGEGYALQHEDARSIGRVHSFYGNFLVCLKALVYISMLGGEGIREAAETAVLNANYLKALLSKIYNLPIDRLCKHEFVLNDEGLPGGVTTNDVAKRILDYGFHAPTIYFPLLVPGAMMIEPTETESKASLDRFIDAMRRIREEIDTDPEMVKAAPHTTPVGRVDAVAAARKPVLTREDMTK